MLIQNFPTIPDRKIRIALVGCGRIAQNHFNAIQSHSDDLELVAISDLNTSALDNFSAKYEVAAYDKMETMLQSEMLDLVVLCTPSGLHSKQAILAANYGIHVLTEKPMATSFSDGLAMINACDDAGVRLFVVKQNRLNPTMLLLKRAIEEERFGKIHLVHSNVFWTRPQEYYDQGDGWRGTWEFDGGAFMNQASHYIDLLEWLIGPVSNVHSMMSTTRLIEAEDTGVVNLKWRRGTIGSMAVTMLTYPQNLEGSITILGERGTVQIGGVAVNQIKTWNFLEPQEYDSDIEAANYETTSVYGFGHINYYKNVIDVLTGKEVIPIDGREGLKSLELLTAIYRSNRDNKLIGLPLKL